MSEAQEKTAASPEALAAFEQWAPQNAWLACAELRKIAEFLPVPEGLSDAEELEFIAAEMRARFGGEYLERVGRTYRDAYTLAERFNERAELALDEPALDRLANYLAALNGAFDAQKLPNEPSFSEVLADFERFAILRNLERPAQLN